MRLRNKKTGEILFAESTDVLSYPSLSELNEEWEDYRPKEPLIKDEKICKAVRAWAEANDYDLETTILEYTDFYGEPGSCLSVINDYDNEIRFSFKLKGLKDGNDYTIEKLCGEEE